MAASLAELYTLINDPTMNQKVQAACLSASISVGFEDPGTTNHAQRIVWAKAALDDPVSMAPKALHYAIGAARADGKTLAQISALDDVSLQNYVNASINVLA